MQMDPSPSVDYVVLQEFLESRNLDLRTICGARVEHDQFGGGTIADVRSRHPDPALVKVEFDSAISKSFQVTWLGPGRLLLVSLPELIAGDFQSWWSAVEAEWQMKAREENDLKRFREVARRFHIPPERIGVNLLLPVVQKLDECNELAESEITLLLNYKYHFALGCYYRDRFAILSDYWLLARACSQFRKAKLPKEAINITESRPMNPSASAKRAIAAFCTARGGAFRDAGLYSKAKESAIEAIALDPQSYYPHNLIGAIYYFEGDPVQGDDHFAIAEQLGARRNDRDAEIRSVLQASDLDVQESIARHLLSVDAERYDWASRYVNTLA